MTVVDDVLGTVMIGVWWSMPLWTLELVQARTYFTNSGRNDGWFLWLLVIGILLVDTATTAIQCRWVYHYAITEFTNSTALGEVPLELALHNILVCVTTSVCQWYLAWRFLHISKNKIVFAVLLATSAAAQGIALYVSYLDIAIKSFAGRLVIFKYGEVWFSLEVATDVFIAIALTWYLLKFRGQTSFSDTKNVLLRLVLLSIESGTVSSACALAIIISAVTAPLTNWCVAFLFAMGRIYGNTFLFNLNVRRASPMHGDSSMSDPGKRSNPPTGGAAASYRLNNMGPGAHNMPNVRSETHDTIDQLSQDVAEDEKGYGRGRAQYAV